MMDVICRSHALRTTALLLAAACALGSPAARPAPAPAAADAGPDLTWLGDTGGNLFTIAATTGAAGDRLFVAAGARIEVYDNHDPDHPVRIGVSPPLPGAASGMTIEGTRLYANGNRLGLHILDIAQPAASRILGRLPGLGGAGHSMAVANGFVFFDFVADGGLGVDVVNARNAQEPRLVSTRTFPGDAGAAPRLEITWLEVSGSDLAVLATDPANRGQQTLILLDAADPIAVREHGRVAFETIQQVDNVMWHGDLLYASANDQLWVIDAADRSAPRVLGQVAPPEADLSLGRVYGAADRLYQTARRRSDDQGVLVEYDLADPAAPRPLGVHDNGPWGILAIAGDRLYASSDALGSIGVYALGDAPAPVQRSRIPMMGFVTDTVADPRRMFILGKDGLWTVDPAAPWKVQARWKATWSTSRMALRGDLLYMAAVQNGLRTLDMRDPAAPRELDAVRIDAVGHAVRNILVHGPHAYALVRRSREPSDIWVLDLTRPEGPARVATLSGLDIGWNDMPQLVAVGRTLLVSSDSGPSSRQIVAIDIGDPVAPREVSRLDLPEHVWAFANGAGTTVYAGTDNAILVLDAADPAHVVEQDRLTTGEDDAARAVRGLGWQHDRLYALLAFPPTGDLSAPGLDNEGFGATLRSIEVARDGQLRAIEDLPLAGYFNTGAAHRPMVQGPHVAVTGGRMGVAFTRTCSCRSWGSECAD